MTTDYATYMYAVAAVAGFIILALIVLNIILLIWMCRRNKTPFSNTTYRLVPARSKKPDAPDPETSLTRKGSYVNNSATSSSKQRKSSKKGKNNAHGGEGEKEPYEIVGNCKNVSVTLSSYSDSTFDKLKRTNRGSDARESLDSYGSVRPMLNSAHYDTTFSVRQGLNNPEEPYDSVVPRSNVVDRNSVYETTFDFNQKTTTVSPMQKPKRNIPVIKTASHYKNINVEIEAERKKASNNKAKDEKSEENDKEPFVSENNKSRNKAFSETSDNIRNRNSGSFENEEFSRSSSTDPIILQGRTSKCLEMKCTEVHSEKLIDVQGENLDDNVFEDDITEDKNEEVIDIDNKDSKEIQTENSFLLTKIKLKERQERQSACTQVDDADFEN